MKTKDKLDRVFSKYIRLRDAIKTTGTKTHALCITCETQKEIKRQMHAGHWLSRAHHTTRYEETNVHAQCISCNAFKGGMPEDYRRKIIEMYGEDEVERLYLLSKGLARRTEAELQEMLEEYKIKLKALE